jgi:hypothetical protein
MKMMMMTRLVTVLNIYGLFLICFAESLTVHLIDGSPVVIAKELEDHLIDSEISKVILLIANK